MGTMVVMVMSASCQSSHNRIAAVPTNITTEEASWTTPVLIKVRTCSTSFVSRVTSWPVSARSW